MAKLREGILLLLILLAAAVLRFTGLDWDEYNHYHPDERYISWVATTIERPSSLRTAFSPTQSSFNPYYWPPDADSPGIVVPQGERRDFAYGHLPLYLGVAATRLVERIGPSLQNVLPAEWLLTRDLLNGRDAIEFRHLTAVARALTGLFDLGTILLLYLLGRRLFSPATGLVAAALLAVNVMHIQLAHFFVTDPYLTFFVLASLCCLIAALPAGVTAVPTRRQKAFWLLGALCAGFAVGSKFAASLLVLPLALTTALIFPRHFERWLILAGLVLFGAFFLSNPFSVLDFGCDVALPATTIAGREIPQIRLGSCLLENVSKQGSMVRGERDVAFVRQYAGTTPYLYFFEMQFKWGMGPLLALLAFAGGGWAVWRVARPFWAQRRSWWIFAQQPEVAPQLILLAWCLPFFLVTGNFQVKFMRYLQPLVPFLMLYGAAWLVRRPPRMRWAGGTAVLLVTTLYAVTFVNLYAQPHPWNDASRWIYNNIPAGAVIASEQWDDTLPTSLTVGDTYRRSREYENEELTWLTYVDERDTPERLQANLEKLAGADYVVIVSNRIYGVVPRLPGRYPISSQYHQLLFDGALGYEPVYVAGRAPQLAGIRLRAETFRWPGVTPPTAVTDYLAAQPGLNGGRADESFIVYDQPLTIIFANQDRLSAAEMAALFTINE
jgi:4-amino-4-deoxy-L-arabinose transferase-like glycosyltransferase